MELHLKDHISRLRVPRGVPLEIIHSLRPLCHLRTNPLHQVCLSPPVSPQVPLDSSLIHIKALGLYYLLRFRLLLSCPYRHARSSLALESIHGMGLFTSTYGGAWHSAPWASPWPHHLCTTIVGPLVLLPAWTWTKGGGRVHTEPPRGGRPG